jgi:hypothetical protein
MSHKRRAIRLDWRRAMDQEQVDLRQRSYEAEVRFIGSMRDYYRAAALAHTSQGYLRIRAETCSLEAAFYETALRNLHTNLVGAENNERVRAELERNERSFHSLDIERTAIDRLITEHTKRAEDE